MAKSHTGAILFVTNFMAKSHVGIHYICHAPCAHDFPRYLIYEEAQKRPQKGLSIWLLFKFDIG